MRSLGLCPGRFYRCAASVGLRARLLLIGLAALLPLLLVMLHYAGEERERALATARDRLDLLASVLVEKQTQVIEQTERVLQFLATAPEVRSGGRTCDSFLARQGELYPWIAELRVSGIEGGSICGSDPRISTHTVGERSYFRRILEGSDFVVSEPLIGRASGAPRVIAAVPLRRATTLAGAVSAAIELQIFSQLLASGLGAEKENEALAFMVDRNGVLIARYPASPDLIGTNMSHQPVVNAALGGGFDAVELPSLRGVMSLYVFRRVPTTGAIMAVGISRTAIIGPIERANWWRLLLIAAIFTGSVLIGLLGSELTIFRPLQFLVRTARALENGDIAARTGLRGIGEVGTLARALDSMAEAIRDRERQLLAARQAAEQASQAKTDFLASMSHEIRTPLTGIVGYTELLHDGDLSPDQRRYLERIEASAAALLTVVDDVLNFSRLEAGQIHIEHRPFSLVALLDNAVSIVRTVADKKALPIHVEIDPDLPNAVLGDEARLRQVLLNLLNNAVKFTPKGRITLMVERVRLPDTRVRFSVVDTGIGIPKDQRKQLFRRFSQVRHSTAVQYGGTGLGLAISKRLVELMGGTIGVESEEGRGSTFWVELDLPTADAAAFDDEKIQPHTPAKPARVLVADDLEMNQEIARTMLQSAGHEVEVVSDGAEAIEAVKNRPFDLVLMDVRMRDMDGVTATREIRKLPSPARHVPIIAMTANVLPQQVRHFKEAGMNDHLGKPFTRGQLMRKIEPYLLECASADGGATPAAVQAPAFDAKAFHEMAALIGRERVEAWIEKLREQLQAIIDHGNTPELDRENLARKAHALVSQAGSLGFSGVSQMARGLEQACLEDADLKRPLVQLRAASREAIDKLGRLAPELKRSEEGIRT